jgi:hypothetical protein
MDDKPLLPGQWIDDTPDPLETVADVEELTKLAHEKMAAILLEKIRTGSYYANLPGSYR